MPAGQDLDLLATRAGELLDQSPPDAHPHTLAAAIRLSTDRLAEVDPAALALVRVGAFLAPETIPAEILTGRVPPERGWPAELAALAGAVASPVAAHRSLGRIGRYGMARVQDGLRLHRLTQAVLRDQLPADHTTAYRGYAQALLVAADPGNEQDPGRGHAGRGSCPTCWPPTPPAAPARTCATWPSEPRGTCTTAATADRRAISPNTCTWPGAPVLEPTTRTPCG
jgi:hypothetical protein